MNLSDIFSNIAQKTLSETEVDPDISHQHEINVGVILNFFEGDVDVNKPIRWYYFSDDEDAVMFDGEFKVYDSRSRNPNRHSEWRMYYTGNLLWEKGRIGDLLVLVRMKATSEIIGLIFQSGSLWRTYAKILFDFQSEPNNRFQNVEERVLVSSRIEFYKKNILTELGLDEYLPINQDFVKIAIKEFSIFREDLNFPSTREMSSLAQRIADVEESGLADDVLLKWLETEELLFRAMEDYLVKQQLSRGFKDTDEFLHYSISILNRRKARMGFSFENHLEKLFTIHKLKFNRTPIIEGRKKPDFLFPGKKEYEDSDFPLNQLFMLGAKSTCKDRWRQVLTEADKIQSKHLCTLEPAISENQLNEMKSSHLMLVIPENIHQTYTPTQTDYLLSVSEFIDIIKRTQFRY